MPLAGTWRKLGRAKRPVKAEKSSGEATAERNPMSYTPHPIDTTGIELPADLAALLERLAENSHDSWAQKRIDDGWKYGPTRRDDAKEHPDLVPYQELDESEKDLDRVVVRETLKAIIALGYRIVKE